MVKTLRITTITAALLAAGFLIFPAVLEARGDKAIEEFLKSPGAIEKFQRARGDEAEGEGQISPLVKQARAFALYLNAPAPKRPPRTATRPSKARPAPRPKVTSAKFKLLGTSFYALHPDLSLALIDEVGKGIRWVRRSGQVGHLVIDQIKDGLVVVKDGRRTFEVAVVERPKKVNLIKSPTLDGTDAKAALQPGWRGVTAGQMSAEESAESMSERAAALDELVRELKAIQAAGESEQAETEEDKEADAALEKFIETIRISAEEAKELNNLGRKLQNGGEEPNVAEPNLSEQRSAKIERKPQQREK